MPDRERLAGRVCWTGIRCTSADGRVCLGRGVRHDVHFLPRRLGRLVVTADDWRNNTTERLKARPPWSDCGHDAQGLSAPPDAEAWMPTQRNRQRRFLSRRPNGCGRRPRSRCVPAVVRPDESRPGCDARAQPRGGAGVSEKLVHGDVRGRRMGCEPPFDIPFRNGADRRSGNCRPGGPGGPIGGRCDRCNAGRQSLAADERSGLAFRQKGNALERSAERRGQETTSCVPGRQGPRTVTPRRPSHRVMSLGV